MKPGKTELMVPFFVSDDNPNCLIVPLPVPVESITGLDYDCSPNNTYLDLYIEYENSTCDHFRLRCEDFADRTLLARSNNLRVVRPSTIKPDDFS